MAHAMRTKTATRAKPARTAKMIAARAPPTAEMEPASQGKHAKIAALIAMRAPPRAATEPVKPENRVWIAQPIAVSAERSAAMAHATEMNPARIVHRIVNAPRLPVVMASVRWMKHARTAAGIAAPAQATPAMMACAPEQKHARTALMIAGSAAAETRAAMRPALLRKIVGTVRRIADRAGEMSAEMMPVRAQRIAPHAAPIAAAAVRIPRRTAAIVCAMRTKPATPASRIAGRAWLLFAAMQSDRKS